MKKGEAHFIFEDGLTIDAKEGDAILILANVGYKMSGDFDAVLVNSPAFDMKNEEQIELWEDKA